MTEDYLRMGRNYEVLIRRAFNCNKGKRNGANRELFTELYKLEIQDKESIYYRRRFQKTQHYIGRALSKLRKRKRYYASENEFSPIQLMLQNAKNANDLAKIASLGLAKIIECENRLRESG